MREYEIPDWPEPLRPSLVFLQSCLALSEEKGAAILRRGAAAVVGTSTRTYSASGGAFTLAYFNALLYDRQSLGGSLRQAKNFMQTFSQLKEKRLGSASQLGGANLRTAWAFTLWGDPTLQLPAPSPAEEPLPHVRHRVQGNTIRIEVPETNHGKTAAGRYESHVWPNARLGGLLKTTDCDGRQLVPLVFAEMSLRGPDGKAPRLLSRLPAKLGLLLGWPRSCGYLLAVPRRATGNCAPGSMELTNVTNSPLRLDRVGPCPCLRGHVHPPPDGARSGDARAGRAGELQDHHAGARQEHRRRARHHGMSTRFQSPACLW